jgi:hypothetical protein
VCAPATTGLCAPRPRFARCHQESYQRHHQGIPSPVGLCLPLAASPSCRRSFSLPSRLRGARYRCARSGCVDVVHPRARCLSTLCCAVSRRRGLLHHAPLDFQLTERDTGMAQSGVDLISRLVRRGSPAAAPSARPRSGLAAQI